MKNSSIKKKIINAPISIGELVDKITILEIKKKSAPAPPKPEKIDFSTPEIRKIDFSTLDIRKKTISAPLKYNKVNFTPPEIKRKQNQFPPP